MASVLGVNCSVVSSAAASSTARDEGDELSNNQGERGDGKQDMEEAAPQLAEGEDDQDQCEEPCDSEVVAAVPGVNKRKSEAPDEKPMRTRRKKEEVEPVSVDVGLRVRVVFGELQPLMQEKERQVHAEEYIPARDVRARILEVCEELSNLPVCPGCFVEVPAKACRDKGAESRKYLHEKVMCSYCRPNALRDFTAAHFEECMQSLRKRVRGQVEMVTRHPDAADTKALGKGLQALSTSYGCGGGLRNVKKNVFLAWLFGPIVSFGRRKVIF